MTEKYLYWIPRLLSLLAIMFLMMFSFDCLEEESVRERLLCLVMHNLPAFVFILALIIAWKWELPGGILFIAAFIGAGILFGSFRGNFASLIIIGPFLLIGIFFIFHHHYVIRQKHKGV